MACPQPFSFSLPLLLPLTVRTTNDLRGNPDLDEMLVCLQAFENVGGDVRANRTFERHFARPPRKGASAPRSSAHPQTPSFWSPAAPERRVEGPVSGPY